MTIRAKLRKKVTPGGAGASSEVAMTDQALTPSPPLPQGLMTRKPLADIIAEGESHSLGKTLGPVSITALGIGCIIGAGIFVLTGTAAARYPGPGIMLSFIIGGIACAFVGLCYAELASAGLVT